MRSTVGTWVAGFLAFTLVTALSGCARGPRIPREELNVLLITLDTTRPDQLGCYGSEDGLTPNLDALAREGTVFEEAIAPTPITLPSHASILTGLYPFHHGVRVNGFYRLADEHVTLAELMQGEGMSTAGVVGAYVLYHSFQLNQGFDYYDDDFSQGFQGGIFGDVERRADIVTRPALLWLEKHRDERFFLWIHYFDPHTPYAPPPEYREYGTNDFGLYQGEIAYMDHNVGRVVAHLKELGLYEKTAIVAVGDHGEAFGSHGEFGHGLCMYNSTLLVPLIVRLPNVEGISHSKGHRVDGRVSLTDVAPTILEIAGIQAPGSLDGRSLLPYLEGAAEEPGRTIYAETAQGKINRGWSQLSGIYSGQWKFILAPTTELYDLSTDPGEETNLASHQPSRAEELKSELVELVSRPSSGPASSMPELDSRTMENLRTLGYITGGSPPEEEVLEQVENDLVAACRTGRDPKDMIEVATLVDRGLKHLQEGRPEEALSVLEQAQEMESEDLWLWRAMGEAYGQLKMHDEAIVYHRKVLELVADDAAALNSLGVTYQLQGRFAQAKEMFQRSIDSAPHFFRQHLNLAVLYHETHEYARADSEFQIALELARETARAREEVLFSMAYSRYLRGELTEARELAKRVLRMRPDHRGASGLLRRLDSPADRGG